MHEIYGVQEKQKITSCTSNPAPILESKITFRKILFKM